MSSLIDAKLFRREAFQIRMFSAYKYAEERFLLHLHKPHEYLSAKFSAITRHFDNSLWRPVQHLNILDWQIRRIYLHF